MFFTTWKGLIAHKLRLFATALAVTLGVAFMAGTLVLTDTVTKTFDDLFGDIYRQTDVVVRGQLVGGFHQEAVSLYRFSSAGYAD